MNDLYPKHSFLFLLSSFFFVLIFYPLMHQQMIASLVMKLFFSLVLVSSLYILSYHRHVFFLGAICAIFAFLFEWLSYFHPIFSYRVLSDAFYLIFIIILITTITRVIFFVKEVSLDTIYGAACIYLMLGIFFATVYSLIELFIPGSFAGNFGDPFLKEGFYSLKAISESLIYFSYVTLTTLGYGDITPVSTPALKRVSL
jgi:voltage-gated potassium channel